MNKAVNCFKGLRRPLYADGNTEADENKYALTWKPGSDFEWSKGPIEKPAPSGKVFVTIISENIDHQDTCPEIEGWIESWSWVEEEGSKLIAAPVRWTERYKERIWTVGGVKRGHLRVIK